MVDALTAVEAAISAVTKARQSLKRSRSRQVSSAEEIDRLKSVAYAWFQTNRPSVSANSAGTDLGPTDEAFRAILDATAKHAARVTYGNALKAAAKALAFLRTVVATAPATASMSAPSADGSPPNFGALTHDKRMQDILIRRWAEIQTCVASGACMSATVMMGGMLESLLLARINASSNSAAVFIAKAAPRDNGNKTLKLADWKLRDMIEVAHELRWITKSAKDVGNVLRDFRNYIHPHKEHSENVVIGRDDAAMFWQITKTLSAQVLASVGKSP